MAVESIEFGGLRERVKSGEVSYDQVVNLINRTEKSGEVVNPYFKSWVQRNKDVTRKAPKAPKED